MIRRGAAILGVVVLSGCAYYNTLYNSERLFQEAEAYRRAGRDSLADAAYRDVIRKTSSAYRGRPEGEEAARTLALLGRAQLRVGRPREARAALQQAAELARGSELRSEILVHLAFASARLGEDADAFDQVDEALRDGLGGAVLGEAYLLRGRLGLQRGEGPAAWEDLDLASAVDPVVAVDAGMERLRWAVHYRAWTGRERRGELLVDPQAGEQRDTIAALVSEAAERWSPAAAATLLGDVDASRWDRPAAARSRSSGRGSCFARGSTGRRKRRRGA